MSSEAQLAANRANAQHSCGPITAEGKAAVSQNRTIHGLNSSPETFRVLPCENQADYDLLLADLLEDEEPANTVEKLLVLGMAQHRWLADRATRLQETCLDPQTGQITDQKLFSLYLRYATTHERAFHKCLNDLLNIRLQTAKSEIGSDSNQRKSETHSMRMRLQEIEISMIQLKALHPSTYDEAVELLKKLQNQDKKAA
jgi:hypothetical protein